MEEQTTRTAQEIAAEASQKRAEKFQIALDRIREHPSFGDLIEMLESFSNDIMRECIRAHVDLEAIRWYQAEYAIYQSLLGKFLSNPVIPQVDNDEE